MGAALDPKQQVPNFEPQDTGIRSRSTAPVEINRPRRFARVPTHAVGVASERRFHPRAALSLPLRLTRIGEQQSCVPITLVTRNISSSGVYFLAPRWIEPGTAIEFEVALLDRPLGQGSVRMCTAAHIVRTEHSETSGWHGFAARFDDIDFRRDDVLPPGSPGH